MEYLILEIQILGETCPGPISHIIATTCRFWKCRLLMFQIPAKKDKTNPKSWSNSPTPNPSKQPLSRFVDIHWKMDLKKLIWTPSISAQLPETFDLLWGKPFENLAFQPQSQGGKIWPGWHFQYNSQYESADPGDHYNSCQGAKWPTRVQKKKRPRGDLWSKQQTRPRNLESWSFSNSLDRFQSISIGSETFIFRRFELGSLSTCFRKSDPTVSKNLSLISGVVSMFWSIWGFPKSYRKRQSWIAELASLKMH